MKVIKFSHNWNKKLFCDWFTTIRLGLPQVYKVGYDYEIQLNGKSCGIANCEQITVIRLSQINEYMAALDMGYQAVEAQRIIQKMYPGKDWSTQDLYFILFKRIYKDAPGLEFDQAIEPAESDHE